MYDDIAIGDKLYWFNETDVDGDYGYLITPCILRNIRYLDNDIIFVLESEGGMYGFPQSSLGEELFKTEMEGHTKFKNIKE